MKRLGITGKLVFSAGCIFLGLGLAVAWHSISQLRSMLYEEMVRRVEAETMNWIEVNRSTILLYPDSAALERRLGELRARQGAGYAILLNADGKSIAASGLPEGLAKGGPAPAARSIRSRVQRTRDTAGRSYQEVATDVSTAGTGMNTDLDAMFGLAGGQETRGVVLVGVDQAELDRRLTVLVRQNVLLYAALVLLALGVNIIFAKRMVTPIARMGRVANQIAGGNLSERVKSGVELQDEVGELVRNFNQMAARLEENRDEVTRLHAGLEEKVRERTAELERANRRLQELDELKSRFLSTVAHELRTPVTSIKAYAEILLDAKKQDPAVQRRFVEIIDKESERLSRLISDLLDLSKIESGRGVWRTAERDLNDIITDAAAGLATQARMKNIQIEVAPSGPQPVLADGDRLQQVALNVLGNGIKYSPEGGQIKIRLDRVTSSGPQNGAHGQFVRVAVEDRGAGIPSEEVELIFERFYRGKDRKQRSGTGLGLTICREIVAHHGGEIWVESQLGIGSTFYFTVPLYEEGGSRQSAGMA